MTKAKSLYQTKLILDCLSKEEYSMIPKDIIEYIEKNMEYDENIKIDANIELEKQDIDEKTYEMLDKVLKRVNNTSSQPVNSTVSENAEIINLKNIIESLRKENEKIAEAKQLILGYKKEIDRLNQLCFNLEQDLNSIPKFIKNIFIKKGKYKYLNN